MKSFSTFFTITFILISSTFSYTQTVLSLEECIQIAQENSLTIKKANLLEKEALINEKFAKQQMLPSLNANSSLSYNIGRRIDPTTNSYLSQSFLSQGINLNSGVVLYNGNSLRNRIKMALMDKKATIEDISQMKRDVALMVTNIYLSILYAQENLENSKSQYQSSKEQLDKMKKMVEVGAQPFSATLNLEAQLLADEQRVITGQNEVEKSYLDLKNILLKDSEEIKIRIPDIDVAGLSKSTLYSINELYIASLKHNPGFTAAEFRVESAKLQKNISKASLLPSISMGGGLSTNFADKAQEIIGFEDDLVNQTFIIGGENIDVGIQTQVPITQNQSYIDQIKNNWGIGLAMQISIPIYNNYSVKANIQRSKLGIESAQISKDQLVQDIKSNIQKALSDSKAASSQYFASKKTFDAQKAAFDNAKKQYDIGMLGSYDYLNAKLLFEQSQNNLLISKYQYIFRTKILDFYIGENLSFN